MTEDSKFLLELHSIIDDNTSCVVRFSSASETMAALDELDSIKSIHQLRKTILRIRKICRTEDGLIHYPLDKIELPKARWVTVSVSASYPIGVPVDFLLSKSGLSPGELSAYHSSKNNPTSKYLFVQDGLMKITMDGITWLLSLLEKDKQVEPEKSE
ncbi:MAG: hypothetical protein ACTSWA_05655 [Candidatus Thorarchaeota archaeon]